MVGMWLRETSSCSSLTVLSGFAWVLLNKIYQLFFLSPVQYLPWYFVRFSTRVRCVCAFGFNEFTVSEGAGLTEGELRHGEPQSEAV